MLARLPHRPFVYAAPAIAVLGSLLLVVASFYHFMLFIVIIGLFSVVVCLAMFMVAFNARDLIHMGTLKYIALAMFFVGSLKLLHLLAHESMNVLNSPGRNLPAQLCMAAQILRSTSILISTFYVQRDLELRKLFWAYAALLVLILASIYGWPVFPTAWIAGVGATPAKRWSAIIAAALATLAIANLMRQRDHLDRRMLYGLTAYLVMASLSDLILAAHMGRQDIQTVIGQLFRFGSTVLLYHAIVESSLRRPMDLLFRDLAASEARFRTVADFTHDWEMWHTPDGILAYVSPACERVTGYTFQECENDPALLLAIVHPDDRDAVREHMQRHTMHHTSGEMDFRIITKQGQHRWIGHVCQPVYDQGEFMGIRSSNRDITARKRAERQRNELIEQLEHTIAEVHQLSGLIPICASCKKVRTDEGYWQSVEEYVQAHSRAGFTHGICPECAAQLYPELSAEELAELQAHDNARPARSTD